MSISCWENVSSHICSVSLWCSPERMSLNSRCRRVELSKLRGPCALLPPCSGSAPAAHAWLPQLSAGRGSWTFTAPTKVRERKEPPLQRGGNWRLSSPGFTSAGWWREMLATGECERERKGAVIAGASCLIHLGGIVCLPCNLRCSVCWMVISDTQRGRGAIASRHTDGQIESEGG